MKGSAIIKPNFIGIGSAKAGTTKVAELLAQHPEIYMSTPKELHYFDDDPYLGEKSKDWYFSMFRENKAVGEFTPSYLFVPGAAKQIYDLLGPNIRFIVSLRNPVDRAYSHYCHAINNWSDPKFRHLNYPIETLSFEQAIAQEPMRLARNAYHIRHLSYFSKGLYAEQLRRYFSLFTKDKFFIYLYEDFVKEPEIIMKSMTSFLGVEPAFSFTNIQQRVNAQTTGELSESTREQLANRYEASIGELEVMLGRKLDIWRYHESHNC